MVGVLQTGTVLWVRNVTHHGEHTIAFAALRALTGQKLGDDAAKWRAWWYARRSLRAQPHGPSQ